MIPKTVNFWASIAIGLALVLLGAYIGKIPKGEEIPLWAVLAQAGVGFLALAIKGAGLELKKSLPTAGLGVLLGLALLSSPGCANPHGGALKAATALKRGCEGASAALAAASATELQTGKNMVRVCNRLRAYRDNIRPAVRSSVAAVFAGVRIAREAGKDKIDYAAMLKPGGCAIILGLRAWGHKLPDKGASILPLLELFQGVACSAQRAPEASPAAAALVAVLPAVVDLVKWIVQLVGAPTDTLEKELSDWLQGPITDEVDTVIAKWCPAPAGGA